MTFVATELEWAKDLDRNISIHVGEVAGLHLLNNDHDKWKVFFRYRSLLIEFSCRYFFRISRFKYKVGDRELDGTPVSEIIIPRDQLFAHYSKEVKRVTGLPPTQEAIDQLYQDVEEAILATEMPRYLFLSQRAKIKKPVVKFIDHIESDDHAAKLLDDVAEKDH